MKMVEPYISIISPASSTPTLIASAAASIVPAMTGVPPQARSPPPPRASPCRRSPSTRACAAASQARRSPPRAARSTIRVDIVERAEAGRGVMVDHRLAGQLQHQVGGRRQDRPRPGVNLRAVRFSQRIFGPTDCVVSVLPQRSSSVSSPIAAVSSSISAAARPSTP